MNEITLRLIENTQPKIRNKITREEEKNTTSLTTTSSPTGKSAPVLKITKAPLLLTDDFNHIETDDGVFPLGHLIININIDASGHVNHYKIMESTVAYRIERQIISQINDSKWAPAEFNGDPVAYSFDIRIDLSP